MARKRDPRLGGRGDDAWRFPLSFRSFAAKNDFVETCHRFSGHGAAVFVVDTGEADAKRIRLSTQPSGESHEPEYP
jgi:hypothetical protein